MNLVRQNAFRVGCPSWEARVLLGADMLISTGKGYKSAMTQFRPLGAHETPYNSMRFATPEHMGLVGLVRHMPPPQRLQKVSSLGWVGVSCRKDT
jgi:hypothetical protein